MAAEKEEGKASSPGHQRKASKENNGCYSAVESDVEDAVHMPLASLYGDRNPFIYDYDTVRTTGLVLAIVMFILGIVIALSNKFKCKQSTANRSELEERQNGTSAGGV